MPTKSGGAQNLRPGDRVRIALNGCYRHFLDGCHGRVTYVLSHSVVVVLDNDPSRTQVVIGAAGAVGRLKPQHRMFQYHEVVKLDP